MRLLNNPKKGKSEATVFTLGPGKTNPAWRLCFGFFLLELLLILSNFTVDVDAQSFKKVLILNSYNRGYQWTDNIMRGIDEVLNTKGSQIEVSTEYMDTKRINGPEYWEDLIIYISKSLRKRSLT